MSIPAEQLEGLSAQDLITALQSGAGVVSEFLGLEGAPGDFKARRPKRPRTDPSGETHGFVDVAPTFTTEHAGVIYALSPEERLRLQANMAKAGVLDDFVAGDADPNTLKAYEAVLSFANRNGYRKVRDALDALARAQEQTKSLLEAQGGLGEASLPAPETVRQSVKQALISQMGRAPDDLVESMVQGYTSAYSARIQGSVQPPTIDAFVASQVEDTPEAEGFQLASFINDDFYSQFDSPVGGPSPVRGSF